MKQVTFTIEMHQAEADEKGFWVSVPALPGCFSKGGTYEEAVENAREAVRAYVESLVKRGESIPLDSRHPATIGVQISLPQMA